MKQNSNGIQYRPSIDGMRSLAVIAVLVYHLDNKLLPGGFVGVDVFFVISGYLITSIIYSASKSNAFSISLFYQRRISRIFPVLFVVVFVILIFSSLLYTSQDLSAAGTLAMASVLSVTNLKLMMQKGNYFEGHADSQPFLHFWSLSVEEQFYLFLPILFIFGQWFRLSKRTLLALLIISGLASFIACQFLTSYNPTWAFYLLPTRAWELLSGAILGMIQADSIRPLSKHNGKISFLGLVIIILSIVLIRESQSFPGYIALFPVIGSVLLIGKSYDSKQLTERIFSCSCMVKVGKISYSLYLWHWPVYSFVDYSLYQQAYLVRIGLKISLTIVFALTSYYIIEKSVRAYMNKPSRKHLCFTMFVAGVAVCCVIGYNIRNKNFINSSISKAATGGIEFYSGRSAPNIVLLGDSVGSMYASMMRWMCVENNINLNVMSVGGGDPFPDSELYNDTLTFLDKKKPDITILAVAWALKIDQTTSNLAVALEEILKHSTYVILVNQAPLLPTNDPRELIRRQGLSPIFEDSKDLELRRLANEYLLSLKSERILIVQIDSLFTKYNGEIIFSDQLDRQYFHDRVHLSGVGAKLVVKKISNVIRTLLRTKIDQSD